MEAMSAGSLGWALIVVGSLLTVAGGILVWVGQQLVTEPEKLVPASAPGSTAAAPVLDVRQHKLLQRIWDLQQQFNADYLVLGMTGRIHIDGLAKEAVQSIDLKVEILGGEPVSQDDGVDPEFERLVDSMPTQLLRRLDREDPNKYLRWGRNVVLKVAEDGIRYLRNR